MNSALQTEKITYRFDDVTVDIENFRVSKNGLDITLTPRGFDVLAFLLQNSGRVIEKKEIFDCVWKDTFVGDNALTKIIKEIRQATDDDANNPRYIETVLKRGYRFIAEVEKLPRQNAAELEVLTEQIVSEKENEPILENSQPSPKNASSFSFFSFSKTSIALLALGLVLISLLGAWLLFRQKPTNVSAPVRSIAVLPFKPLNANSRDESLEMGMAETLITKLSNLKQITVRPMSAVSKYTDLQQDPVKVGREIQAEAVLEGSIQKADERVRVTIRLTDVRSGESLWSEQFDENFTDIFKVQDSIAERVTNALTLQLSRQEKDRLIKHDTDDSEAYQLYLRGQLLWNGRRRNWIEQSLDYYSQALKKDPNFALAHIGVADCYIMLSGHRKISMADAEIKARPSIVKALEIDNTLAQAHNALAELKYQYEYDWSGAEKEFKIAIELNPNVAWIRQAYGWFLMSAGRFDEAAAEMDKAQELDPSSLTIRVGRGRLFYYSRQYDQAIQYFQNIIAVEPNDISSYMALYDVYVQKQMYREAVEIWLKIRNINGNEIETKETEELRETLRTAGWQGYLHKELTQIENRTKTKREIRPSRFAELYVRLGRRDEAFFWLKKSFEAREPFILQFKIEPAYDILRDDPRYTELIHNIGL